MKKVSLIVTVICLICVLSGCNKSVPEEEPPQSFADHIESVEASEGSEPEENELELEEMSILMKIDDETVTIAWEDNESVAALAALLNEQPMSIQMSMYGGFEQVGSFGTSLPRDDEQTTTQAGDIVLYSGNQIVVFYGSNSWAYTRLGRITDKSAEELKEMLGGGDVTITLELVS
ncbi:MAG: hypothetical protein HDR23_01805 [Lachnospiraceae bacterium]|nr:hypothetical protein [Lachnospiraceae bacterium]